MQSSMEEFQELKLATHGDCNERDQVEYETDYGRMYSRISCTAV